MRFTYDNSSETPRNPNPPPVRVRYGLETTDEMAELWFLLLPGNPADRGLLGSDFSLHLARSAIEYNESLLMENPADAEAHTRVGRAQLYLGQIPQALLHLQEALKSNPNYDRAWYELGYIYLGQEQLGVARHAFENVVRLNHEDYQAE